jgi:hypothetical protein
MILSVGSKVLIVHRRLFESDHPRYFVGQVDGYESGIAKVTGYTWVYDPMDGKLDMKGDSRTKILSLVSGGLICYELPTEMRIESLVFKYDGKSLTLTDSKKFKMDLSENYRAPLKLHN